jgi:hypothetical protein
MKYDFFANSLVLYIEKKIDESFNLDSILGDFIFLRDRKLKVHF